MRDGKRFGDGDLTWSKCSDQTYVVSLKNKKDNPCFSCWSPQQNHGTIYGIGKITDKNRVAFWSMSGAMDVSIAWIGWSNTPSQSSNWPLLTKLLRTLKDRWLRYDFTRPNGVLRGKPAVLWEYTVSCSIPIYDRRLRHTKLPIISRFLPDVWWLTPHILFLQPNVFTYKYGPFTSQLNQRCPVIAFLLAISRYIRIFSLVLGG